MPTEPTSSEKAHESLEALIEKNIEWSEKIYKQNKSIKRYIVAQTVGSWLRILLILVPLIIAAIYLPPLLKPYIEQMQALLTASGNANVEFQELLKQFQK